MCVRILIGRTSERRPSFGAFLLADGPVEHFVMAFFLYFWRRGGLNGMKVESCGEINVVSRGASSFFFLLD